MRVIVLAAVLACAPAFAQDEAQAAVEGMCASRAQAARTVMTLRQKGMPVERAMEAASRAPEGIREHAREITLAAYEAQRWHTAEMRQRAVEDFGDGVYLHCLRG